ncbi:hypothetical protein, partial [Ruminococcus flavefaciens]|uniref:hypothetical protein n=1 Tax=Ruminococcus flavefaciens TaxID=1265 RepID=UPI00056A9A39
MKKRWKRLLSLAAAGVMTVSLLPSTAFADDPQEEATVTPDTSPTINWDYASNRSIMNANDALKDLGAQKKSFDVITDTEAMKSQYYSYKWQHPTMLSVCDTDYPDETGTVQDLRHLLESESAFNKYIALPTDIELKRWENSKNGGTDKNGDRIKVDNCWAPIKITENKVLDLNGHKIKIDYYGNINHGDKEEQEYRWEESHYLTAFEIEEGATLTIIDSSQWRGSGKTSKGTGSISFDAGEVDHYDYALRWYDHRDLFHVNDGNLVIYGGTFQAGSNKVLEHDESNFSWSKLKSCIGTAVELGVSIAEYSTGITEAEARYNDVLHGINESKNVVSAEPKTTEETQKNTPTGANDGRNQSISEKIKTKDAEIAESKEKGKVESKGTSEGEQKANSDGTAKDDDETKVAKAKNEIVNQVVNDKGIKGMVDNGFKLIDSICGMIGTTSKPRITNSVKGTVVRIESNGTFASYGGHYIGNGCTPNLRNAVIECQISTKEWPLDCSKQIGGKAYIYDGDFEANSGANVFNMYRGIGKQDLNTIQYTDNKTDAQTVKITYDEHYGVEPLYYNNQDALATGTDKEPVPVNTANVQVRGGTFHCNYDVVNMAKKEAYNDNATSVEYGDHFTKFPGTPGAVNLGVNSFGADMIRDGRIQITDNADGCLVLLDDQEEGYDGLYHYRLFCGDNELRTKAYLKVYPNQAVTNSSYSMQLAYYLGTGKQTKGLYEDDGKDNIRSPYRQMENYFDFQIDDPKARENYAVKPNFHSPATEENEKNQLLWDVYGKKTSSSEVWYYPTPLDKNGEPIDDTPYGNACIYFNGVTAKFQTSDQWDSVGTTKYRAFLNDKDVLSENYWTDIIEDDAFINPIVNTATYKGIHTNMKYFTYKVYKVDPVTRENLNANDCYGQDDPLLTVRYGCAPEESVLKCKLPLDELEQRIKKSMDSRGLSWEGYRAGEMYRIVLEVEEHIGIGEKPQDIAKNQNGKDKLEVFEKFNGFGQTLRSAKTTTSILFRCFESTERSKDERAYLDTDFTPVQWPEYPTNMHTIPAGRQHTIELRNGKTGMIDWEADSRIFDVYYQWWEVTEEGEEVRLLAGTDNVFDDGLDETVESGTKYDLSDKANHKPDGWKLDYIKESDGKPFMYCNTVDPKDPSAKSYNNPKYPNIIGLPTVPDKGGWKCTAEQLHMYSAEMTGTECLKYIPNKELDLYNNDYFANNTDSCYIPNELIGKYIQVRVVVINPRWPLAYDKKQTFKSHIMQVCDPRSPEGYLNIETDEEEDFGQNVPATFSMQGLRDFYDGSVAASVTYFAYGKCKQYELEKDKLVSDLSVLPTAKYPKDFTDTIPEAFEAYKNINGVFAVIGLTTKDNLKHTWNTKTGVLISKYVVLKRAPELDGWFTIKGSEDSDPDAKDDQKTFSITDLEGLNAGETISSVIYCAYGKYKVFKDLSIYDPMDLPEARYPVGFTDKITDKNFKKGEGDIWVKVITSKGSKPYREIFLDEDKPDLNGTASIKYDEGMNYATFDHPATFSLDLKDLAFDEEVETVTYKVVGTSKEKTFSRNDNPELFENGLPTAQYPDDFFGARYLNHGGNKETTFCITVTTTRNGKELRKTWFYPENHEKFKYVVMAEKIERNGAEVETITLSDYENGKYDNGINAFSVFPTDSRIGYSFSDFTTTNDKVATLVQDPNYSSRANIKLTGEPGDATISMKSPDGTTVSKTVRVVCDFDNIEISGVHAPVIGEKLDFDSVKVPDNAPYKIKDVSWIKVISTSYIQDQIEEVGPDDIAENYYPYRVLVTVEPKENCVPDEFNLSCRMEVGQTDGSTEYASPKMYNEYDEETHQQLPIYTFSYTYPAQSDHAASVIDEIHIDFPTEVEEGTYWNDWVKNIHIYTNGYDEGLTFDIRQSFGPDAESIASPLGYSLDAQKVTVFRFVKGIQNGIVAEIKIPEELKELGDVFADKISVYINGEKSTTPGYYESGRVLISAPDTLIVTGDNVPEAMPSCYSIKPANAVVGDTINLNNLFNSDDPRVSIRMKNIHYWLENFDDVLSCDFNEGTVTPLKKDWHGFDLYYIVSFDADNDKNPEYEYTSYLHFSEIYETASDVPKPQTPEDAGIVRITLLDPDGTEIKTVDYPIDGSEPFPTLENTFIEGTYDSTGKVVSVYEKGKRYTVKTVSVDDFETYAGTDSVYGFIKDSSGKDISSIQISIDGKRFYADDHITGLTPDTAYVLYYRRGKEGTIYTKEFCTAAQDYGVYIGRQPVTDKNLGDLEKDGWTYDPDKKTLTFKNFSIKDIGAVSCIEEYGGVALTNNAVISSQDELTVRLIGDNSIESTGGRSTSGIYAEKSLIIEGNGNLTFVNGEYGLKSNSSSVYLDGTGKLTFDKVSTGLSADKGIIEYTNGNIEFIPKLIFGGINYYPSGSLISPSNKDGISFTSSAHKLTVNAGATEEESATISESELTDAVTSHYLNITPQHHDVYKIPSAEAREYGTCSDGCTYHFSCDCGHLGEVTYVASAEEHAFVKHEAKPASCDEPGNIEYWECEICGECFADENDTEPLTDKDIIVPVLGHNLKHTEAKSATCDKPGNIEYWECETCGKRFADEKGVVQLLSTNVTISTIDHEWVQHFAKPVTCDEDGTIEYWECKNCGQFSADKYGTKILKKEDVTVEKLGHVWNEWIVSRNATESVEGEEVHSCSICDETETRAIPKIITTTTTFTTTTAKSTT